MVVNFVEEKVYKGSVGY